MPCWPRGAAARRGTQLLQLQLQQRAGAARAWVRLDLSDFAVSLREGKSRMSSRLSGPTQMSREDGDLAQKVAVLRTRFPDVAPDLIQDMLAQSRYDTSTAANMLISIGCPEASPRVEPKPAPSPSAAQLPATHPLRASVFDAYKREYVSRALEQAKGDNDKALDVGFTRRRYYFHC